jgi:hypothetical protein
VLSGWRHKPFQRAICPFAPLLEDLYQHGIAV